MKHDPYNHLLLNEFPYLKATYQKVKDGVFDLDTPAYSFYEEIFVPYIVACIRKNDARETEHCFSFIEDLLESEEEMLNDLAMKSILCILYEEYDFDFSVLPLGRLSKDYYENWLKTKE